ncbi:IclR family transcriptional regulator [Enteractinococcus helveticum]|uniref:IclR family transcriptional regulator n=1 Tax=Enteractinococcus helveticum TaxID=1837282 RepID=A0A1B7M0V2_9MICC|nr:IclR family transcriptional regulator [Enteractinococcus helveticum]OAV61819.1 IclR family transcriptional regulator [Enteractinococcus helveticum]
MSSWDSGPSGELAEESPAPVESVDRALRLLLYLRDHDSISVKEAAAHLGIAASTAHRLLSTLIRRKFIVQDFARRYRMGTALSIEDPGRVTGSMLVAAAEQPLAELQARVGETVQVMVLRGGNIRFLDGLEPEAVLRVSRRVDDEMPAFVSAGGKAILGRLSNQEVEEIYRRGLMAWPTRRVQTMQMLKRMLTQVRQRGYALSAEETEQGVAGVGVSVVGPDARPVGALTIAIPSARFRRALVPEYVAALQAAAQRVQDELFGSSSVRHS